MGVSSASEWMRRAKNELKVAVRASPQETPEVVCYLTQQCIEKCLKSILVFENIPLPYTHDLEKIRKKIPSGWAVKDEPYDFRRITDWAVSGRYPISYDKDDNITLPDENDAKLGLRIANDIYKSVKSDMDAKTK